MRPIKFRYFDRFSSEMIDVISIDFKFNTLVKKRNIKSIQGKGDVISYEDETIKNFEYAYLMQFTGLFDLNGKEIYEGDIIKTFRCKPLLYVKWDYDQWGLFDGICNEESIDYSYDEIIGNIHQHPELLCNHEYDNTLLLSYPAKKLCNKFGHAELLESTK